MVLFISMNFTSCNKDEDLPNAEGAFFMFGTNGPVKYSKLWIENKRPGLIRVDDGSSYRFYTTCPFTEEKYFYIVSKHLGKVITSENINKEVLKNDNVPETCKILWRFLNDYEYIAYDLDEMLPDITMIFTYNER